MLEDGSDNLVLLIGAVRRRLRPFMVAQCERFGYQPVEAWILFTLSHQEGLTQKEIGSILAVNKTFVMRAINSLVEKKLVERRKDGADNRANYIYLTPGGLSAMPTIREIFDSVEQHAFQFLTVHEKEVMLLMLNKADDGLRQLTIETPKNP